MLQPLDHADPFDPLLRILDRYRRDVHQFEPPPPEAVLSAAALNLGQPLPPSLRAFLERWDGASLFRGALRVRPSSHLAPADASAPGVIIFADGPGQVDHWAFAIDGNGEALFGRWLPGEGFEPQHRRFERWLFATARILDENQRDPQARLRLRLECDSESPHLLLAEGERLLGLGEPARALPYLERAAQSGLDLPRAWARYGDALEAEQAEQARFARLKALRALYLPSTCPRTDAVGAELIEALGAQHPGEDADWERELVAFLDERVVDTAHHGEQLIVEAAVSELCRLRLARQDRAGARDLLIRQIDRIRAMRPRVAPVELVLQLARLESELGQHDDAERHLRLLREGPHAPRALLELGRIAVMRQEPWVDEILEEALQGLGSGMVAERIDAMLLKAERLLLIDRAPEAARLIEQARPPAEKLADPRLLTRLGLLCGDAWRMLGDGPATESWYRYAQEQAQGDPELQLRVLVRRGDLFRMVQQPERAAADYARAADGYAALGLPLREAWARLRLAQMGQTVQADLARSLFKGADLAAGVAAADAISGDPGRSLDWHLERAGEHSRDRANAQRARPPLSRADAERPERRIGAHRSAVAACDVRVVGHLARALDGAARALDLHSPRASDPNLARYVAAIDLLSAHRSFEAAEVLLRHLLELRPSGLAGRALVGAMARSPNAAMVAGLLEAFDGGFDPQGMALAAEVLGWRREREAVPTLRKLLRPEASPTLRRAAVVALGRVGDDEAIEDLLDLLDEPDMAEEVSTALLLLGEWKGVDEQAQALARNSESAARSLGEIVGRYGGPAYLLMLVRVAERENAAGLGALQGLGYLGDPRAVPRLLDAMGSRDPMRGRIASAALEVLTGHREDPEESLLRNRWLDWWDRNSGRYTDGRRYRYGQLMDPGLLVDRLGNDDPLIRRLTYDELVISSGVRMPFDVDGPWRVQVAHRRGWNSWWAQQRKDFPPGRWTFHGQIVG